MPWAHGSGVPRGAGGAMAPGRQPCRGRSGGSRGVRVFKPPSEVFFLLAVYENSRGPGP